VLVVREFEGALSNAVVIIAEYNQQEHHIMQADAAEL
jgi:hypothetical protein